MRKLEQMTREIVTDMNYLKKREERMRDTNGTYNSKLQGKLTKHTNRINKC